jgi:SAM-dependent methyltransferase
MRSFEPWTITARAVAAVVVLAAVNGSIVTTGFVGSVVSQWRLEYPIVSPIATSCRRRRLRQWQAASNPNEFLDTKTLQEVDTLLPSPAHAIYSQPALYDLAFGYRDYVGEVEFLLQRHTELSNDDDDDDDAEEDATTTDNAKPLRIVEVAAGPARHALTALSMLSSQSQSHVVDNGNLSYHRDARVYCVDASTEMAAYACGLVARTDERRRRRQRHLGVDSDSSQRPQQLADGFSYQVADMRTMVLPEPIDTAWILLGSLQHLLTNEDVLSCLQCLYAALKPGGTVFIELPHPRELFGMGDCTRNSWKVPLTFQADEDDTDPADNNFDSFNGHEEFDSNESDLDDDTPPLREGELSIVWGDQGDAFDPVTQVRQFTIAMEWIRSNNDDGDDLDGNSSIPPSGRIRQVVPLRIFTVPEISALAQGAGFEVAAMYGALEHGVAMNDEESAYRFVCALRKPK